MKYLIAMLIISNCIAGGMIFEVSDKNGKTIKKEFIQAKERKIVKEESEQEKIERQKQESIKWQKEQSEKATEIVNKSIIKGFEQAGEFFKKQKYNLDK